jgi:glycosyltransferase involved in cell wall biosynthesis
MSYSSKQRGSSDMLSVIIATKDCERRLVPTLAALVSGAAQGLVRDVIVADGGSKDETAKIADIAGCAVQVSDASLAARLTAAARAARGPWLMFLRPGTVLDPAWIDDTARFVEQAEERGDAEHHAAVFRRTPGMSLHRSALAEVLMVLGSRLIRPRPEQGLVIFKRFYDRLGGHRDRADPEADLMARIGRKRIVVLRSGALTAG